MVSTFSKLRKNRLLQTKYDFIDTGIQYEVLMGSVCYGVSNDESDFDVYGFCIPPRDFVFPHLRGEIEGFSTPGERFEQFQQHHILDKQALGGKGRNYDITVYSIVKYFRLLMDCNPNIIDSLFVPRRCVLYSTQIGEMVRENRQLFLQKGVWPKFKGYAYSQLHKLRTKQPEGDRKEATEKYGYDIKYAYHVVRLLNEVEQILHNGTLDLEKNKEQLKEIRRGLWTLEQVETYFAQKELHLEELYLNSNLPIKPDEHKIRSLLLNCLEQHYGSLKGCIQKPDEAIEALKNIQYNLNQVKHLLV